MLSTKEKTPVADITKAPVSKMQQSNPIETKVFEAHRIHDVLPTNKELVVSMLTGLAVELEV